MKKKVRVLTLAMASALCLSLLAGCGGKGDEKPAGNGGAPAGATIKVGILAPLTGDVAQYGIAASNGAKLYFDQVNAKGGINGKQIEYIVLDEKGQPADAVTAYTNLVDQGVTAIVGDVTTTPSIAVADQSVADNMPLISGTATGAAFTTADDGTVRTNVFRACFLDPFQGETMAGYAAEKLGAKTAGIIYNVGSDYSTGLTKAFKERAAAMGLTVVAEESYADTDVDFNSQLTNIAAKKPDVLFCPDYYQKTSLIVQQAKNAGITATLLGSDGWDGIVEAMSDPKLANGALFCAGFSKDDTSAAVQTFLSDYSKAYSVNPSMFAAQSYDAAQILCAALTAAEGKGLAPASAEYKAAVIEAMAATDADFVTGHMTFDKNNNPVKAAAIIAVKDGNYGFDQWYTATAK